MPLVQTRGAASAQGFGEFAQKAVNYIEDVFSTYLYNGTNTTLTITNGIDLSTKDGLVWVKDRLHAEPPWLYDTVRGGTKGLRSSLTDASNTNIDISSFNTDGFTLPANSNINYGPTNPSLHSYVSWTFRKQPKFFDVVTWTGNGANRTIPHSLDSVPGMIIVKRTDTVANWAVYHRSLANTQYLILNTQGSAATGATWWNSTTPTSTVFSLGTDASVNASGGTYVAYVFAHNAGGFGLTGLDNVISCGSYTGDGLDPGPAVTLGFEPQWIMVKKTTNVAAESWAIKDVMRGMPISSNGQNLYANLSGVETADAGARPTSTGFQVIGTNPAYNGSGETYIYIAIRRPMKAPTTGTSVFAIGTRNGTSGTTQFIPSGGTSFPTDLLWSLGRDAQNGTPVGPRYAVSRLTDTLGLELNTTGAEAFGSANPLATISGQQNTVKIGAAGNINGNVANTYVDYFLRRAPSFMDVVVYDQITSTNQRVSHNLTTVPELIICKIRTAGGDWLVYSQALGRGKYASLTTTSAFFTFANAWGTADPTTTDFGTSSSLLNTGYSHIAYLFSTLAGVSKVGSYTGTATTKQIDCGFTAGARWIMIKRTDSTGGWYVWDTTRGIVAGNDPYLVLNTTAVEITNTDYIDTYSAGFELSSTAPADINASGGTYIFLAIA
jgi:hypothetical protein